MEDDFPPFFGGICAGTDSGDEDALGALLTAFHAAVTQPSVVTTTATLRAMTTLGSLELEKWGKVGDEGSLEGFLFFFGAP